ncbi:hypothetical protein ACQEUV_26785 [Micromonospora aurantiaca (nom. illeg.)]|uniref:hypothetical protein n=1 Tax=Micromonospora aurantiaca (nom. illeg.) TaxID=47850 RepID=UPI003DA3E87C
MALFITFATLHDTWMRSRGLPSPDEDDTTDTGVNPQVTPGSDTDDTADDTSLWGRIVNRGGRRVRVYTEPARDAEVDVDLEDDEEFETLEEAVDRMDRQGVPYAEIVRRVMVAYQVSESTAKRRIRDSRKVRTGG